MKTLDTLKCEWEHADAILTQARDMYYSNPSLENVQLYGKALDLAESFHKPYRDALMGRA